MKENIESLLDDYFEVNLSNYDEEDVSQLSAWAIRAVQFLDGLNGTSGQSNPSDFLILAEHCLGQIEDIEGIDGIRSKLERIRVSINCPGTCF